ncbi:aminotransferase class-III [Colletotrichum higginsianum]|nr:aminotransferase class-III [Colletotrichum higginsianum]
MSGMGRSGTLHAWQHEDVIPDIQTIAKGLGGGYAPMAGMLINHRVAKVLGDGTGYVSTTLRAHNKTADGIKELSLMGTPIKATQLALEVQRIIQEEELVSNVRKQGALLEKLLREHLGDHPYVGNIRGKGLFWGVSSGTPLQIRMVGLTLGYRLSLFVTKEPRSHSHGQQMLPIESISWDSMSSE